MSYFDIYRNQVRKLQPGSFSRLALVQNYFPWKNSMMPGKNPLNDGMPWMTFDAIRFLKKNLKKNMKVFEYGSGGSSVFFSKQAGEVISIEHNKEWFTLVKKYMDDHSVHNWTGMLCEAELSRIENLDPSDPDGCVSSDAQYRNCSFKKYVESINQYPDGFFDLVVVDGRARPSCIKHAISKLKTGGYILLDNSDREHYQKAITECMTDGFVTEVGTFGPTSYSEDFTQTLIRRKLS